MHPALYRPYDLLIVHDTLERAEEYIKQKGINFPRKFKRMGDGPTKICCWGSALAGLGVKKIIAIGRMDDDYYPAKQQWVNVTLKCRLLPGGRLEIYWIDVSGKLIRTEGYNAR